MKSEKNIKMENTGSLAGIMTFHAAHNYGSVLQAYATQKILNSLGVANEIINYRLPNQVDYYNKFYTLRFGKKTFFERIICFPEYQKRKKRSEKFEDFINTQLQLTDKTYQTYNSLQALNNQYDMLIAGSDQIWNIHCTAEFKTEPKESILGYYLAFANDKTKKISFSSSIGGMTDSELLEYRCCLKKFAAISVRENETAERLEKILGSNVASTLDPTLMLTNVEWEEAVGDAEYKIEGKYLLLYSMKKYKTLLPIIKEAKRYAALRGLTLVCIAPFSPVMVSGVINAIDCGPLEFVNLIRHAELVITDSFHGTAFSLNLGTPFYTLNKGSDKRKQQLLSKVGLMDRVIMDITEVQSFNDISCDFVNAWNQLKLEREKSLAYLKNAISGESN